MSSTITRVVEEPKLDKPGAGLPFIEWFVAKYFLLPQWLKKNTREQAIEKFQRESQEILRLASGLTAEQLTERRLIKRLRGLEDSSRYWSVAMTIEHLVIVGGGMRKIVKNLAKGTTEIPPTSTADVKPHTDVDVNKILDDFRQMTDAWTQTAKVTDFSKFQDAKFAHPWFGPLTAVEWVVFAPVHQRLHRQQIEEIIKLL